jgi:methanogenic corrinoid protein MtbC1
MSKEEIIKKLTAAMIELEDEVVEELIGEAVQNGLTTMEIVTEGLNPGLTVIGEGFEKNERFMSDLMIAGQIMNDALEILLPKTEIAAACQSGERTGDFMVIGTVEGDLHNVGKRIVSAVFGGAGIRSVDIGENKSAEDFVQAVKEYKANIVGASAIIGPVTPYCKVIHKALVDAGIRDDVLFIAGGWGMTEEWCNEVGADTFGENALDGLCKTQKLLSGEIPRWKDRVKK